ncbi:hypothetical protein WA026_007863 [Henosepilachna vigintioctopunctata]|uniref:Carboxylesterase type B domain-containing protein n=1 Tax=Henosepilachna vigintioctopunctata TaxID=420089 RepID=A0AAW1TV81_9CUCU
MAAIYATIRNYSCLYSMKAVSVAGRLLILRLSHQNTGAVGSLRRISNYRNTMEPVIECKLGRLRGKISESCLGGQYYSFQGIPYAKAPVGNLRFKVSFNLTNVICNV